EVDNLELFSDTSLASLSTTSAPYQSLRLPDCEDVKFPHLLINPTHFAVTQAAAKVKDKITELKPIKMLLVKITPDTQMQYVALTAAGAEYYSFLLNSVTSDANAPAYAIISSEGDALHTSDN